mmetsp:Transcript_44842/g.133913  ORF Transcript_44842/g.133913 Transcript_44842/m.133913 type:complete len:210 (+) Transcript_44842:1856-2485(+)
MGWHRRQAARAMVGARRAPLPCLLASYEAVVAAPAALRAPYHMPHLASRRLTLCAPKQTPRPLQHLRRACSQQHCRHQPRRRRRPLACPRDAPSRAARAVRTMQARCPGCVPLRGAPLPSPGMAAAQRRPRARLRAPPCRPRGSRSPRGQTQRTAQTRSGVRHACGPSRTSRPTAATPPARPRSSRRRRRWPRRAQPPWPPRARRTAGA